MNAGEGQRAGQAMAAFPGRGNLVGPEMRKEGGVGQGLAVEIGEEAGDGVLRRGVRPVIADAIGKAEVTLYPGLGAGAVVVGLPMGGVFQHHGLHLIGEGGAGGPAGLAAERVEGVKRLAPGEGQGGADFLKRETQFGQAGVGGGVLVVGGMGLKAEVRPVFQG